MDSQNPPLDPLLPWIESDQCLQYDCGWFSVHQHNRRSQRTGLEHDFYLIETRDWVNVIPVLADGRTVFVRQYRQAAEAFGLEVPAGVVDPGEDTLAAARRELKEETGYGQGRWSFLGSFYSNPALIRNKVYVYLAEDVLPGKADPDPEEELEVMLLNDSEVQSALLTGTIHNAVTMAVLHLALMKRNGL